MKRFSLSCLAIGVAMLCAVLPFRVHAQGPPTELAFSQFAKTYCMQGKTEHGKDTTVVRTSIDLRLLENPALLEEVQAHELMHQAWYQHNLNQCGHLTPRLALSLEVDAYCRTADIPVHYGGDSSLVYFRDLSLLVGYFNHTDIPYRDIVSAWYIRCGDLLPLPRKASPPVTRDTTHRS